MILILHRQHTNTWYVYIFIYRVSLTFNLLNIFIQCISLHAWFDNYRFQYMQKSVVSKFHWIVTLQWCPLCRNVRTIIHNCVGETPISCILFGYCTWMHAWLKPFESKGVKFHFLLKTSHGGSATLPRRIRCSGNVQPLAAAVSGRRPESAPQPFRASGNVPLSNLIGNGQDSCP